MELVTTCDLLLGRIYNVYNTMCNLGELELGKIYFLKQC